jgi:carboxymethylenebutenolidase
MKAIRRQDIHQEVFDLYDDYAHHRLDRRTFMERLSVYAVGGLTLPALLRYLMPDYRSRTQIGPDDPRLVCDYVIYPSPQGGGDMRALVCRPADAEGPLGGVVVLHENRGLNPHIEDVARRAALAGFIALAPDALSPLGGYPGNDDDGRTMQATRDRRDMLEDFIAGFRFLQAHPGCKGRVGVVGFCFGGWIANMMAVRLPDLAAAVPFYGGQPPLEEVPAIRAPLQLHYAGLDTRVNEGWPAFEEALLSAGKSYSAFMYEGKNHGFHNDTTPRYDTEAAQLAWERTMAFFREHLQKD